MLASVFLFAHGSFFCHTQQISRATFTFFFLLSDDLGIGGVFDLETEKKNVQGTVGKECGQGGFVDIVEWNEQSKSGGDSSDIATGSETSDEDAGEKETFEKETFEKEIFEQETFEKEAECRK
jgi:hypothetical protein